MDSVEEAIYLLTHTNIEENINGRKRIYSRNSNGKIDGEFKSWFKYIHRHAFFKNGLLHGVEKKYCRGDLRSIAAYKDNVLHGEKKRFDRNGKIIEHCIYHNGKVKMHLHPDERLGIHFI